VCGGGITVRMTHPGAFSGECKGSRQKFIIILCTRGDEPLASLEFLALAYLRDQERAIDQKRSNWQLVPHALECNANASQPIGCTTKALAKVSPQLALPLFYSALPHSTH